MRSRVLKATAAAGVLVLVGGGVAAYAARGEDSATHYRYATAVTGDVAETLAATGTVDAAGRSDVAVAVDGTVARVRVRAGQRVHAGQVLATLDRTSLAAAVTEARAGLARARAQLAADEAAQDAAVSDAESSSTPPAQPTAQPTARPSSSPSTPTGPDQVEQALAELHEQQAAVTSAQSAVTDALEAASTALDAQTAACAGAFTDPTETATPEATPSDDPSSTSGDQTGDETDPDTDQACADALALVQQRQQEAATAEDTLASALADLTTTLTDAVAAVDQAAHVASGATDGTDDQTPSAPAATDKPSATVDTPNDSSPTVTVTAARLASDQAAIDQAEAQLLSAQQALARAVVRAPASGRVVQVGVSRGDAVSAGDIVAVIRSGRAAVVTTTVPETQIHQVEVGQKVRVTPVGARRGSIGTIADIGLTADTSSGTASYPVTVTVPRPQAALLPGASASLQIVVATAHDVVTLPVSAVSAVTGAGGSAIVRRYEAGAMTPVPVTLGTVGARTVEVTEGLSAGDRVVLADLDQAITDAGTRTGQGPMFFGPGTTVRMPTGGIGGPPTVVNR